MKTFCANTYKRYLQQQTIGGKTQFTTNSMDYINFMLGEGDDILLQKITYIDVITMDLKRNSNISIDVALVKAAT